MLHRLRSTCLATLISLAVVPAIALAEVPAAANTPVPLLWKVSDADNAVYLLGSFHLLKPGDYPLAAEVEAAFDDSAALVFEIDPAELTSPATTQKFQQAAAYEDGKTLSAVLPEDVRTLLTQRMGSLAAVDAVEPWALTLGMVMGMAQAVGFRPEHGLDQHFMRRAGEAGKPVSGLETVDVQVAALDKAPYSEQIHSLKELLQDTPKAMQQLNDLHTAWRNGDVRMLDGEMRQDMIKHTPVTYRLINIDRNNAWLPAIEKRLTTPGTDNTLVVVGALHLMGNDGLVDRLRAKGYAVERLCSACVTD